MKLSISNLGRIKSADLDIKPLTVFVGKANTNKTWTAYTLYGILRSLTRTLRSGIASQLLIRSQDLDSAIDLVTKRTTEHLLGLIKLAEDQPEDNSTGEFSLEVSRSEILNLAHLVGEYVKFSVGSEEISSVLAVDRELLTESFATLELKTSQFVDQGKLRAITIHWSKQFLAFSTMSDDGGRVLRYATAFGAETVDHELLSKQIHPQIRMLAEAIYDDAMAFPSERKGLSVLLGFNDPFRKETLLDRSSLTQAASDYLRFLSPLARRGPRPKAPNSGIVALLENQVMHGKADFHGKAEPLVFGFTGEHGPTVQMNASASFVRSLAGLDLYLRTVAGDDVLVIDEPEMNAHPEAQIQLVELFAIMANQGRHVIVTTHSPYFVDHLNNLMQGATLSEEAKIRLSDSLKLRDKGAFITADNAAVYLFREDGEVRDLVRDEVIDVSSFANETDYLSRIYAQIVEAEKLQKGHPHAE